MTYDSDDKMFVVHRPGQADMEFKQHESGLHYHDPTEAYTFVETVSGNKEGFTKRQIKGAEAARKLYADLVYPSVKDYRWAVQSNKIEDCPVTVQDIDNAQRIWGKNVAALKGKTTRSKPIPVAKDFVKVPKEILSLHKEVYITVDIFFVNKIAFFITLSRKICFTSVRHLVSRKVKEIFQAFGEVYKMYLQRGFRITTVGADGEFAAVQALIQGMPGGPRVNLTSANEHVPEIERRIRVVKERCRAIRHGLPYNKIPAILTTWIVFNAVRILNHFPVKGGISESISPKTIMTGETLNYKKHLKLQVGQYCQVHEEDLPRNSQLPRTQGAIVLGPSGNVQGGYKFMSLKTGKAITRHSWDSIPITDQVITRVNQIGKDQPEIFVFTNRKGQRIGDNEHPAETQDDDSAGVDGDNNMEDGDDGILELLPGDEIEDEDVPDQDIDINDDDQEDPNLDDEELVANDEPQQAVPHTTHQVAAPVEQETPMAAPVAST